MKRFTTLATFALAFAVNAAPFNLGPAVVTADQAIEAQARYEPVFLAAKGAQLVSIGLCDSRGQLWSGQQPINTFENHCVIVGFTDEATRKAATAVFGDKLQIDGVWFNLVVFELPTSFR